MTTGVSKSTQGRKNRVAGARFEIKIRTEMEKMGWVVSKWMNTVDYDKEGKMGLSKVKYKFRGPGMPMMLGGGFPDFICFRRNEHGSYEVIGLEVKKNGYLDQVEKGMGHWLIDNKIFSRILVAKMGKEGEVEYVDFTEKYRKKR